MTPLPSRGLSSASAMDALALSLLSTALVSVGLLLPLFFQRLAQRPAQNGVMIFHLAGNGELRLWNQPIRLQELPALLERAERRSRGGQRLVVRLIPDPQVPWGVTHGMLARLRPDRPESWNLQLQLP